MEAETAAGAASATLRKEAGASQGQWAPKDTPGPPGYKDSQDCRAAKVTRARGGLPGSQDRKETWEQEASLDSRGPMEFPDILGKAGPEDGLAVMAAMGLWATQATRDLSALTASSGLPDPKDPKGRKASPTLCLARTATSTGGNLASPDWSVSRGLLAALGLWGRWVRLELQEDRDLRDPLDQKASRATEDLVFTEKKVKRVTWDSQDPMGSHQTTITPS